MERDTDTSVDEQPTGIKSNTKSLNRGNRKILIHLIVIPILIISAAGVAYWLRDKSANELSDSQNANFSSLEKTTVGLRKQLAAAKTANENGIADDTSICTPASPSATVLENIRASITSGNTAALEGYMASSVTVILAASEGIGPSTSASAGSNITSFISDATLPWDFLLPASVLSSYVQGGYGQYFTNIDVVGKSANGKVITFGFDCNGKIDTVFESVAEELLN